MKKISTYMLMLFVIGSITGCFHRYTVVEPPTKSLTEYSILEISEFKTNLKDAKSRDFANRFTYRLHWAVKNHREKNPEDIIYEEVTLSTDKTKGVLLMQGTVTRYEEGSRAMRYWIGLGAGKAHCTIQVVFINKETGEELSRTNFDGVLVMGVFGGDADKAVDGVVDAFIDYMKKYMSVSKLSEVKNHSLTREHPYGTRDTTESHSIIRSINHLYLKTCSSTLYATAALDLLGNDLFRKKEEIAGSDLSS